MNTLQQDVESPSSASRPIPVAARVAYLVALVALLVGGYGLFMISERYGTGRWRAGATYRVTQFLVLETSLIFAGLLLVVKRLTGRSPRLVEIRTGLYRVLAHPTPAGRRVTAVVLGLVSIAYLAYTARWQGHDFNLRIHDENMYMVQAQTIAHGRLWMPQHPHPDFFESFHVYARPVYGAMYFPGTGLFYAIPVRLGLPTWTFSLALGGLCVALTYLVITELVDGTAGLLAALMLITINPFRYFAVMLMSHTLLMALGLLMLWSVLRWRENRRARWLVALGVFSGWAAITRPVDAMCYAAPVGLLFLWELRRSSWGAMAWAALTVTLAALPLLSLQLIMNYGMTGRLLKTPVQNYLERYWPEMQMGTGPEAPVARTVIFPKNSMSMAFEYATTQIRYWQHQTIRPALAARLPTALPQYRDYYLDFILPSVQGYRATETKWVVRERLRITFITLLPATLLVLFIPAGLLGMTDRRRWALVGTVPLFWGAYLFFPFFLDHYVLIVAPATLLLTVLGMRALRRAAGPAGPLVGVFLVLLVVQLSVRSLPEFNRGELDQPASMGVLADANRKLSKLPANERALVFFTFHPEEAEAWKQEPVYTLDAAWPDDARVVRAHDLGERNAELIGYYAKIQPDRRVYRYDQTSLEMTRLGTVGELAGR